MGRLERFRSALLRAAIVALAALLLVPKLTVVQFVNTSLWGQLSPGAIVLVALQDLAVASVVCAALLWTVRVRSFLFLQLGLVATGFLLLVLMLDMRVRQVWLKPADWSLISYGLAYFSDLLSGLHLFFNYHAGWGMTFRRLLFGVGLVYVVLWIAISRLARGPQGEADRAPSRGQALLYAAPIALAPLLAGMSLQAEGVRYQMQHNLLLRPLVALFARPKAIDQEARRFEQKSVALSSRLAAARSVLPDLRPFKNLVIVVYESVRWRDADLDGAEGLSPTLHRMAREGLWSKSRVSVPHSSKAYYAVLTGRHPYPAIEMREILKFEQPSYIRAMRDQLGMKTFAFSSVFYGFENMGGMLRTIGIDVRLETGDLLAAAGRAVTKASSFGGHDEPLYELSAVELSRARAPFVAVLFPLAAHYPYSCPPHRDQQPDHAAYANCVRYSDGLLAKMLEAYRAHGLLEDTLFVVVGDHGESFGEHGMHVHNNSLYEEEVTVPLVFWSADGRMRHGRIGDSRQIDVGPTIADLFGLKSDVPVQGVSLLREHAAQPTFMATFFDDVGLALVEGDDKYLYEPGSSRLLHFDLRKDPFERAQSEVADPKRKAQIIRRLTAFRAYQELQFE